MPISVLPRALLTALDAIYLPAGLKCPSDISPHAEAREYEGCQFNLAGRRVLFRVAKTTPTKVGQVVTLWKRPCIDSVIAPLDHADGIDFVVVNVASASQSGQFVFDRDALLAHGVTSINGVGGKSAMSVYPPWSQQASRKALKNQSWQMAYFLAIEPFDEASVLRAKVLFKCG